MATVDPKLTRPPLLVPTTPAAEQAISAPTLGSAQAADPRRAIVDKYAGKSPATSPEEKREVLAQSRSPLLKSLKVRPTDEMWKAAFGQLQQAFDTLKKSSAPTPGEQRTFEQAHTRSSKMLAAYVSYVALLPESERGEELGRLEEFHRATMAVAEGARLLRLVRAGGPGPQEKAVLYRVQGLAEVVANLQAGLAGKRPPVQNQANRRYQSWGRQLDRAGVTGPELQHFILTGTASPAIKKVMTTFSRRGTGVAAFSSLMHGRIAVLRAQHEQLQKQVENLELRIENSRGAPMVRLKTELQIAMQMQSRVAAELRTAQADYNREGMAAATREQAFRLRQVVQAARREQKAGVLEVQISSGDMSPKQVKRAEQKIARLRKLADRGRRIAAKRLEALGNQGAALATRRGANSRGRRYFEDRAAKNFDFAAAAQIERGQAALMHAPKSGSNMPTALSDHEAAGGEPSGALRLVHRAEAITTETLADGSTRSRAHTDPEHLSLRADLHRTRREFHALKLHGRPGAAPKKIKPVDRDRLEQALWGESGRLLSTIDQSIKILAQGGDLPPETQLRLGRLHAEARDLHMEVAQTLAQTEQLATAIAQTETAKKQSKVVIEGSKTDASSSLDARIGKLEKRRKEAEKALKEGGGDKQFRLDVQRQTIAQISREIQRLRAAGRSARDQIKLANKALQGKKTGYRGQLRLAQKAQENMQKGMNGANIFSPDPLVHTTDDHLRRATSHAVKGRQAFGEAVAGQSDPVASQASIALTVEWAEFSLGNARALSQLADLSARGSSPNIFIDAPPTSATRKTQQGITLRNERAELARAALEDGEKARQALSKADSTEAALADAVKKVLRDESLAAHGEVGRITAHTDEGESVRILSRAHTIIGDEVGEMAFTKADQDYTRSMQTQLLHATSDARSIVDSRLDAGVRWEGTGANRKLIIDASGIRNLRALERTIAKTYLVPEHERRSFTTSGLTWAGAKDKQEIQRKFPHMARRLQMLERLPDTEGQYAFLTEKLSDLIREDSIASVDVAENQLNHMSLSQKDAVDLGISDIVGTYLNPVAAYRFATGEEYFSTDGMLGEVQRMRMDASYGKTFHEDSFRTNIGAILTSQALKAAEGPPDRRAEVMVALRLSALSEKQRARLFQIPPHAAKKLLAASNRLLASSLRRAEQARKSGAYPRSLRQRPDGTQLKLVDYLTRTFSWTSKGEQADYRFTRDSPILSRALMAPGVDPRRFAGQTDDKGARLPNIQFQAQTRLNLKAAGRYTQNLNDDLRIPMYMSLGGEALLVFVPIPGARVRAAVTASRAWKLLSSGAAALKAYRIGRFALATGHAGAKMGGLLQSATTYNRATRFAAGATKMAAVVGGFHVANQWAAERFGRRSQTVRLLNLATNFSVFHSAVAVGGLRNIVGKGLLVEGLALGPQVTLDLVQHYGPSSWKKWARDPENQLAFQMAVAVLLPAALGARMAGEPRLRANQMAQHLVVGDTPDIRLQQKMLAKELTPFFERTHLRPNPKPAKYLLHRTQVEGVLKKHGVTGSRSAAWMRTLDLNYALSRSLAELTISLKTPPSAKDSQRLLDGMANELIGRGVHPAQAYADAGTHLHSALGELANRRASTDGKSASQYGVAAAAADQHGYSMQLVHQFDLTPKLRHAAADVLGDHLQKFHDNVALRADLGAYLRSLDQGLKKGGVPDVERAGILLQERHRVLVDTVQRLLADFQARNLTITSAQVRLIVEQRVRQMAGGKVPAEQLKAVVDSVLGGRGVSLADSPTGPDPVRRPPDVASVALARAQLEPGKPMTTADVQLILGQTAHMARDALVRSSRKWQPDASEAQIFSAKAIAGSCGFGQGATAFTLEAMGLKPKDVFVHQAAEVYGRDSFRHAFLVARMPDGRAYLIDTTFRQFFRPEQTGPNGVGAPGAYLRRTPEGRAFADELLHKGFVELTDQNATLYGRALGQDHTARFPASSLVSRPPGGALASEAVLNNPPPGVLHIDYTRKEMAEFLGRPTPTGASQRGIPDPMLVLTRVQQPAMHATTDGARIKRAVAHMVSRVPGLTKPQARLLVQRAFKRGSPVVLGGRGGSTAKSDLDVGFYLKNSAALKLIRQATEVAGGLRLETTHIIPDNVTKQIARIDSPEQFFMRKGVRGDQDPQAGKPFGPSGWVRYDTDGSIVEMKATGELIIHAKGRER